LPDDEGDIHHPNCLADEPVHTLLRRASIDTFILLTKGCLPAVEWDLLGQTPTCSVRGLVKCSSPSSIVLPLYKPH
jgi:hypothetical protein